MFATRLNRVLRHFRQMHTYFNKLSIGTKPETTLRCTDNWPISLQVTRKGLLVNSFSTKFSFMICTSHFKTLQMSKLLLEKQKTMQKVSKQLFFFLHQLCLLDLW